MLNTFNMSVQHHTSIKRYFPTEMLNSDAEKIELNINFLWNFENTLICTVVCIIYAYL